MLPRAACMSAAFAAVTLFAQRARASPSAHLVYIRDASAAVCPDEDALRLAVKRRYGYDPFFPIAKTTVVVEVAQQDASFVARVRLVDAAGLSRGARELRSRSAGCGGLVDAVALAVSIALDMTEVAATDPASDSAPAAERANAAERASTPEPALAATPFSEPTPAPEQAPSPVFAASSTDRVAADSRTGAIAATTGLDLVAAIDTAAYSVSPGADVWVDAQAGPASLSVDIRGATSDKVESGSGAGQVSVRLLAATVAPCGHLGPAFACALASFGWLNGAGSGVAHPESNSAFLPALGSRAGFEIPLSRSFALRFHGDLLFNLTRPRVFLNDSVVLTPSAVGGVIGAGLAYRFR